MAFGSYQAKLCTCSSANGNLCILSLLENSDFHHFKYVTAFQGSKQRKTEKSNNGVQEPTDSLGREASESTLLALLQAAQRYKCSITAEMLCYFDSKSLFLRQIESINRNQKQELHALLCRWPSENSNQISTHKLAIHPKAKVKCSYWKENLTGTSSPFSSLHSCR